MSEHDDWKRTDAFEEALLRSSVLDEPDAGAVGRAALSLGVTLTSLAVTGAAAAAVPAANAAAAPVASGALAGAKTGLGAALWVKPLMVGAALGTVTTTSVEILLEREAARQTRSSADLVERRQPPHASGANSPRDANTRAELESAAAPEPGLLDARAPSELAPERPSARFADQPANATPRARAQRAPSADAPIAPPAPSAAEPLASAAAPIPDGNRERTGSISEQIEVIDRARSALRSGDARAALAHLDGYRWRWPKGELAIEATVLRIEARFGAGERAAASAEAREFIDAQPNSRYAARLRKLLASEINSSRR